jgi:uncharacterized repeat protein (TIGR02543 family)
MGFKITRLPLLTAICSLLIALLSSCQNPFTGPETGNPHTQIPAGKGSFSLSVTVADPGRTILPALKQSDFNKYTLVFTATNGGTSLSVEPIPSTISNPVYLDPGTYSLEVSAYITDKPVAKGKIDGLVIEDGENETRPITLRVINESGFQGTFIYDVNFPTGITKAEMKITPLAETGTPEQTIPLLSGTGGETLTLNAGYYNVVVTLEKKDAQLVWREILHIYGNLESTFTKNFTNDDFYRTFYTVRFDFNYTGSLPFLEGSFAHGGMSGEPDEPERPGYYFNGWYSDKECTTPFNFTAQIISDTTIYAGWTLITLPLTDVKYIKPYLAVQTTKGLSTDDPVPLSFNLNLGVMTTNTSNWQLMLGELNAAGKYVELDLTSCASNTTFNPVSTVITGKDLIVSITLPSVATSITAGTTSNSSAFLNFTNLKSFSGPGLTSIGNYAFSDSLINPTTITLPSTVTSIGTFAFYRCTNLAMTELPSGLTSIGNEAFEGCTNLALTSLPAGITTIGTSAFQSCSKLALTSLPTGITSIGQNTFQNCTSLAQLSLPNGLTTIGNSAFEGCTNLAMTELPEKVTSIGERAFYGCTKLALISLPAGITTIANYTFSSCTNLALESLPDNLTSIGLQAFYGCTKLALTSLPTGLSSIGTSAFSGCTSLTTITLLREQPPTAGSTMFANNSNIANLRIEVLAGSLAAYKAAAGWSTYEARIFAIGADADGSAGKPFIITSESDLRKLQEGTDGWGLDKHYELGGTITLTKPAPGESNWKPIGTYTYTNLSSFYDPINFINAFKGTFDGKGYSIKNLTINAPNDNFQGMFGCVYEGAVRNLSLVDCNITGKDYVGGIVGGNGGTVENCSVSGSIIGPDDYYSYEDGYVGGVAGFNLGTVKKCYATGSVSGYGFVGGVVGSNGDLRAPMGTVENCYASSDVSGDDYVGGVVGDNYATMENCYATGDISGTNSVGGVVGSNDGTLKNCYATGDVSGAVNVGGVVGGNYSGAVENCYATGNVSDAVYHANGNGCVGGVVGLNSWGVVKNCVALNNNIYTDAGADQVGRVIGENQGDSSSNNYARNTMTVQYNWIVNSGANKTISAGLDTVDGASITATDWNNANWWTGTGNWNLEDEGSVWVTTIWNITNGSLPTLNDMPDGEQKPEIRN